MRFSHLLWALVFAIHCIPALGQTDPCPEECATPGDFDGDNLVGAADLVIFLGLFQNNYDPDGDGIPECMGCTDSNACNFDDAATMDDGSCTYQVLVACVDQDGDGLGDPNLGIYSCLDIECSGEQDLESFLDSFSYVLTEEGDTLELAPFDNNGCGDCIDQCDDVNACNFDDPENEPCEYDCSECMSPGACNYDPNATEPCDGCCVFEYQVGCVDVDKDGLGDPNFPVFICPGDPVPPFTGPCEDLCDDTDACNYYAPPNVPCLYLDACGVCGGNGICEGCTDPEACNFDSNVLITCDGCCEYEVLLGCFDADKDGCGDPNFLVYGCPGTTSDAIGPCTDLCDDPDACNSESCTEPCEYDCSECMSPGACNYDPNATEPCDGCCVFEYQVGCVDVDKDGLGDPNFPVFICPGDPVPPFTGPCEDLCDDTDACNYYAPPNVPCLYLDASGVCGGNGICEGCTDPEACNYDSGATTDDGTCYYEKVWGCQDTDGDGWGNPSLPIFSCYPVDDAAPCLDECEDFSACNYLAPPNEPCEYQQVVGCVDEDGDGLGNPNLQIYSCLEDCAINSIVDIVIADTEEVQSYTYYDDYGCGTCEDNCDDPDACNFDDPANLPCEYDCVPGCTDPAACNYDPEATEDDGTCEYPVPGEPCGEPGGPVGCMDPLACNYDPGACFPGPCEYPVLIGCIDSDGDGLGDPNFQVFSCPNAFDLVLVDDAEADTVIATLLSWEIGPCEDLCEDLSACNYFAPPNDPCSYSCSEGCTNPEACNYNADATIDDGSCEFESCTGCLDPTACNYDPTVAQPCFGCCTYPIQIGCVDIDGDGFGDPGLPVYQCGTISWCGTVSVSLTPTVAFTYGIGPCEDNCDDPEACNAYDDCIFLDPEFCEPCVYPTYVGCEDLDEDGLGNPESPIYACPENPILYSVGATCDDECDDPNACNYADPGNTPCEYLSPCEPVTFDGHTYEVVEIGGNCWFAEDLFTTTYRNGDPIEQGSGANASIDGLFGFQGGIGNRFTLNRGWLSQFNSLSANDPFFSNCSLNDIPNESFIGYSVAAVQDDRGLCPTGWHVSNDDDWTQLELEMGMDVDLVDDFGYRPLTELNSQISQCGWICSGFIESVGIPGSADGLALDASYSDSPIDFCITTTTHFSQMESGDWNFRTLGFTTGSTSIGSSYRSSQSADDLQLVNQVRCVKDADLGCDDCLIPAYPPGTVCTMEYVLVCGCNGVTYTNPCVALTGVASITGGPCPLPCDSLDVQGEGFAVPDDQTQCFSGVALMSAADESGGNVIADVTDIESVNINMEHSFMGDLTIALTCPNESSLILHSQGGGGTYLGVPVDVDAQPNDQGVGYDYAWSPSAPNGTWVDNAGGTLPPGTYEAVGDWSQLIGCPINGQWTLEICDGWGSENGFVFDWGVKFQDGVVSDTCIVEQECEPVTFDGHTYDVVEIGSQCWFAENLRTTIYSDGDEIPSNFDYEEWFDPQAPDYTGKRSVYGEDVYFTVFGSTYPFACNDDSVVIDICDPLVALEEYGRLYNWHAVADLKGLCPVGWRVSTDDDWRELESFIGLPPTELDDFGVRGAATTSGLQLKSVTGWNGQTGLDTYGLDVKPAGARSLDPVFFGAGTRTPIWTSSLGTYQYSGGGSFSGPIIRRMETQHAGIERGVEFDKNWGYSVRCVKGDLVFNSYGCTGPDACNFDPEATLDDGSCYYWWSNGPTTTGCDGECILDLDGDGICDELEGCMAPEASNYYFFATVEPEGICCYETECSNCDEVVCIDIEIDCDAVPGYPCCNGDPYDLCQYYPFGGCFVYGTQCNDGADEDYDGVCDCNEILGCDDVGACNFDPEATEDDGSCEYASCGGCSPVAFDGYTYAVTAIGDDCWFAENLRTTVFANGEPIPDDGGGWSSSSPMVGVFGNALNCDSDSPQNYCALPEEDVVAAYGRLYNWYAVDDARGLCPTGWHVPSDGEWNALANHVEANGYPDDPALGLMSQSGWVNGSGTDAFNFGALPAGKRTSGGADDFEGVLGQWWTSNLFVFGNQALYCGVDGSGSSPVFQGPGVSQSTGAGLSIRCVQD